MKTFRELNWLSNHVKVVTGFKVVVIHFSTEMLSGNFIVLKLVFHFWDRVFGQAFAVEPSLLTVWCVFGLAFWHCMHPKAGWNTFFVTFRLFFLSTIFLLFVLKIWKKLRRGWHPSMLIMEHRICFRSSIKVPTQNNYFFEILIPKRFCLTKALKMPFSHEVVN